MHAMKAMQAALGILRKTAISTVAPFHLSLDVTCGADGLATPLRSFPWRSFANFRMRRRSNELIAAAFSEAFRLASRFSV
jgi:hypothetical protein